MMDVVMFKQVLLRSVSALDLVLVDSGDGLEVSGPATAGALAILGLE